MSPVLSVGSVTGAPVRSGARCHHAVRIRQHTVRLSPPSVSLGQPTISLSPPAVSLGQPPIQLSPPAVRIGQPSVRLSHLAVSVGQRAITILSPPRNRRDALADTSS